MLPEGYGRRTMKRPKYATIIVMVKKEAVNSAYDALNDKGLIRAYALFSECPRGVQLDILEDLKGQVKKK
jgi:hypothetical protein